MPPSRHRPLLLLLLTAALLALVATGWPHPLTGYGTRAAVSPVSSVQPAPTRPAITAPVSEGPVSEGPVPLGSGTGMNPVSPGRAVTAPSGPLWRAPLDGTLILGRAFSPPSSPYGPGHRGVDLVAAPGTQVRAAGRGVVTFAGTIAGRGVTTVSHGSLRTTYEPVEPTVAAGRTVAAGEPIGRLAAGHPGCPAAACLHWGLLEGSRYLDPLGLLRRRSPRLLPLG
ncbi:murein hydrolase activator EnvC family protein [Candidatus Protofrankia datiscae]|uniref:murein hydrolase activator EnvC family protein n=1 Tax=Protofrankia TaxID=2994361 RepID=UPI003D66A640